MFDDLFDPNIYFVNFVKVQMESGQHEKQIGTMGGVFVEALNPIVFDAYEVREEVFSNQFSDQIKSIPLGVGANATFTMNEGQM